MTSTRNRVIGRAARGVPGLRRVPMLKLLALAEVALLAHDHLARLDRHERRRLIELLRLARGRRRNLSRREREELMALVAKAEPARFAATAAQKLSPLPLPEPLVRRLVRS